MEKQFFAVNEIGWIGACKSESMPETCIHVGDWVKVEGSLFHDLEGRVIGYVHRAMGDEYVVLFDNGTSATFKPIEITPIDNQAADAA
jgi:hypothetical protein